MEESETQRYIGFIDLLGFSNFVLDNSFHVVKKQYDAILKTATLLVTKRPLLKRREDKIFAEGDPSNLSINIAIFSDTLILWTNDLDPRSFRRLLFHVKNFIIYGVTADCPVRCSISIGNLDVKHESTRGEFAHIQTQIIGNSLVRAANLEKIQNWSGCIIDPEAITYYDKSIESKPFPDSIKMTFITGEPIVLKYPVPISRNGENIREDYPVINWPNGIREEIPAKVIEDSFKKYHSTITDNVQEKIDNTLQFYSEVRGWTGIETLPDEGYYIEK